MKGYVYVLSNEAMPGLYKIGRSKYGGHTRASAMYKGDTGVPLPFQLVFECLFDDCVEAEALIHEELDSERVNPNREFFMLAEEEAIAAVLRVRSCYINYMVVEAEFAIDPSVFYCVAKDLDLNHVFEAAALFDEVNSSELVPALNRRISKQEKYKADLEVELCTSTTK